MPTKCFSKSTQHWYRKHPILARRGGPRWQESLLCSLTPPIPPWRCLRERWPHREGSVNSLWMIRSSLSRFPLSKWNYRKWDSNPWRGSLRFARQKQESHQKFPAEHRELTLSFKDQHLLPFLFFFFPFNHCIWEMSNIGLIHFQIWLIREISHCQAHNWNSIYDDGVCQN